MTHGSSSSKSYWPSRWVFILAAIGSAAGLGNVWRFPFLAYEHGGGAFVLAIIAANILIGIPLLALEIGLGQMTGRAAPDAFGMAKKAFRYIGWFTLILSVLILSYYMAVMAWSLDFFGASFNLRWGDDAEGFFFNKVLQLSEGVGTFGGISVPVLVGFLISWVLVYFSVRKGIESVSKVVVWTATLPFLLLFILLIRAVTLPGALSGLAVYLIPDWSALLNTELWLAAFSQVFFSLSLAFGIMIAYGSSNSRGTEVTKSVVWIAVGNFMVSFLAGFAVFGTLGYMATQQGVPITEVVAGGPSLVFVVLPQAISLLPAFSAFFALLFFATLALLAIDSAFSLLEAFGAAFRDRFPNISMKKISLYVSLAILLLGIPFVTKSGLYFLDILDHFVVNYGLVAAGILEAVAIGWLWKSDILRTFINERSGWKLGRAWNFSIKVIIPVFLGILFILNLIQEFREPYSGYPVWALIVIGVIPILLAPVAAVLLDKFTSRRPGAPKEAEYFEYAEYTEYREK